MENSRRTVFIVVAVLLVGCLCVIIVGAGITGLFFPFERVMGLLAPAEPTVVAQEIATEIPTQIPSEPTSAASIPSPSPTPGETENSPTDIPTQAPTPIPIPPDIAVQMDDIEEQVILLRNLQPSGDVIRSLLSRDQLRQKIEQDFFEDYSQEEAREDVIVLSALGLLNPDFDMFTFYKDLLSEQIAGQYDHKSKEMDVVQDTGFGGPERFTYAHEYTHALQDQNFDIENGLNYSSESCEIDSERCAAVQALLEGDASLLQWDWFTNYATPQDLSELQAFYEDYQGPVMESAPDYLSEDFLFPYVYGEAFVEYLFNTGGWEAINAAYRDVPVSTEQILHPERYPDDRPVEVLIPDLVEILGEPWQELDTGVMGEWYTYLILAHGRDPNARLDDIEAQIASEGWGGDVYLVLHNEQDGTVLLVMHTSWESENDARQFFDAFSKHSNVRFGNPTISEGDHTIWTSALGVTDLTIQDEYTTWILAPDEATAVLARSAIWP